MIRKNYIDNLRWICVLILFPYHVFMIYNSFGENFYVKGENIKATTTFLVMTWPWFMPLLFAIAGISTAYALQKRGIGEYIRERISKLFIPLAAGILLVIPTQTYFAERFHNGYSGNYFSQYILFFTRPTDLTGYTGGFTPGHLWFILYLFLISLAAIPFIILCGRIKRKPNSGGIPMPLLPVFFILPGFGALVLDIAGKSLGEYFVFFMLGYFLLSKENVQQKLERYRFLLFGTGLCCVIFFIPVWYDVWSFNILFLDILSRFYAWIMMLALIGLGRKYLAFSSRFTGYMTHSSFAVYMFHQTWIIVSAYYVFLFTNKAPVQMALIFLFSITATFITYEICRRIKLTRFLFAIKNYSNL